MAMEFSIYGPRPNTTAGVASPQRMGGWQRAGHPNCLLSSRALLLIPRDETRCHKFKSKIAAGLPVFLSPLHAACVALSPQYRCICERCAPSGCAAPARLVFFSQKYSNVLTSLPGKLSSLTAQRWPIRV